MGTGHGLQIRSERYMKLSVLEMHPETIKGYLLYLFGG